MPTLAYRSATLDDVPVLAALNRQLIIDEGSRNPMTLPELADRMHGWLIGGYEAILFTQHEQPIAYALFRRNPDEIYLRQFFVVADYRKQGIGHEAIGLLLDHIWPPNQRVVLEVLSQNTIGQAFWRSVGFQDYFITMELTR